MKIPDFVWSHNGMWKVTCICDRPEAVGTAHRVPIDCSNAETRAQVARAVERRRFERSERAKRGWVTRRAASVQPKA